MVRDKAVESLNAVAAVLPNLEPNMVPLIRRLAVGDYNSTRIASAPLFALVYPRVSEASKAELRHMFGQLCKDDVPLVRKGACAGTLPLVTARWRPLRLNMLIGSCGCGEGLREGMRTRK